MNIDRKRILHFLSGFIISL